MSNHDFDGTEAAHREATMEAWAREMTPRRRPAFYRVRYDLNHPDGRPRFLGLGPTGPTTRGYPSFVAVLECEAECFNTPRAAAETALQACSLPFTVEQAPGGLL